MSDEETVVDTSGAADSSESALKKRKIEDTEAGEGLAAPLPLASDSTISASETDVPVPATAKKSSLPADPEACVIKFLCPEPAIGVIIGKKGVSIHEIMGETNTKVKISQNGQYFPGTMERVISVTGSMVNIKRSLDRVLRKAHEGVLKNTPQHLTSSATMPAPCGGALIGPGGAIIKRIATESSCNVRVGDNLDPFHTKERFVILTSSSIDCIVAASMVVLDILSTECTANFIYSYPDVTYPMSPGASVMAGYPAMYAPPNMAYGGVKSAAPAYAPVYSMPGAGQAMQGGVGQQPQVAYAPASYPQQYTQQPVPQYATQQTQPTAGGTSAKLSDMPPPSYAQDPSGNVVMTLKVPEKFMGGLLGKAGVVIKSIMQLSGAVIRASPKGEGGDEAFRAMKVTGTGSQVQQAQAAVMHRIVELANNPSVR